MPVIRVPPWVCPSLSLIKIGILHTGVTLGNELKTERTLRRTRLDLEGVGDNELVFAAVIDPG